MAAPTPLIAWPVRFAATSYVVRVTANSVTEDLTLSGLTVGRNYWLIPDAQADADGGVGGVGDLCALLETALETHSEVTTATVTLENWRIKVQLAAGAAISCSLLWSHANTTLDPTVFGFESSDVSSVGTAAISSPNLPQGVWRPQIPFRESEPKRSVFVGGISRTLSGKTRTSRIGASAAERNVRWEYLNKAVARTAYVASDEPTGAWEYAWDYAVSLGYALRVYDDETALTSSDYELYTTRSLDDRLRRMSDRDLLWWQLDLELVELTA